MEWRPNIERLRQEIGAARRLGQTDSLAEAEAECWIDLIDAELSARRGDDPEVRRLCAWRADLKALLR